MLDRAGGAVDSVADERGGLVVPLGVEVVDRVLERGRGRVVVLGSDEDVCGEGGDLLRPAFGVRLALPARDWRGRLIEQGQVVVGYVDDLEARVLTFGGVLV